MVDKTTHFGRAGEYYAMSELLLRGWNVAVPVVDIGDDVFVINDGDKTTWRLQVKSASADKEPSRSDQAETWRAGFNLSRAQLRTPQSIELLYFFMLRLESRWRFLVVPRVRLLEARESWIDDASNRTAKGRKPLGDNEAKSDGLTLTVQICGDEASVWGVPLTERLDTWPDELPPLSKGPGARKPSAEG